MQPEDSVISQHLDICQSIMRDLLGLMPAEPLPDNVRVEHGIYFLTLFHIQNKDTSETQSSMDVGDIAKWTQTSYFRQRLTKPVYNHVISLISPYRKVKRFIPDPEVQSASA